MVSNIAIRLKLLTNIAHNTKEFVNITKFKFNS